MNHEHEIFLRPALPSRPLKPCMSNIAIYTKREKGQHCPTKIWKQNYFVPSHWRRIWNPFWVIPWTKWNKTSRGKTVVFTFPWWINSYYIILKKYLLTLLIVMEKPLGNLNELLFNLKCNYNNISTPLSRSNKSLDPMKKGTNPGWKNWNRKKGNKSSQNI